MKELILHERRPGDDRCSFNYCRKEYEFRYLKGASVLNPKKTVQICDACHVEFTRMKEAIWMSEKAKARKRGRPVLRKKKRKLIKRRG